MNLPSIIPQPMKSEHHRNSPNILIAPFEKSPVRCCILCNVFYQMSSGHTATQDVGQDDVVGAVAVLRLVQAMGYRDLSCMQTRTFQRLYHGPIVRAVQSLSRGREMVQLWKCRTRSFLFFLHFRWTLLMYGYSLVSKF